MGIAYWETNYLQRFTSLDKGPSILSHLVQEDLLNGQELLLNLCNSVPDMGVGPKLLIGVASLKRSLRFTSASLKY